MHERQRNERANGLLLYNVNMEPFLAINGNNSMRLDKYSSKHKHNTHSHRTTMTNRESYKEEEKIFEKHGFALFFIWQLCLC